MFSEPNNSPRYSVSLVGDSVFYADGKIVYPPFNLFRILTILVLTGQGRPVSRRLIGDLIWSENPPDQINADFRQTLCRIKHFQNEHGVKMLEADASMVWFNKAPEIYIDLVELVDLLANPEPKSGLRTCQIYTGDLLASHGPAGDRFEEWLDLKRQSIGSDFIKAISRAILPTSALSQAERKISAARLLQENAYDEGAYRALMLAAASRGEHSVTRRLYEDCRAILRKELGVTPSFETTTCYETLLAKQHSGMAVDA